MTFSYFLQFLQAHMIVTLSKAHQIRLMAPQQWHRCFGLQRIVGALHQYHSLTHGLAKLIVNLVSKITQLAHEGIYACADAQEPLANAYAQEDLHIHALHFTISRSSLLFHFKSSLACKANKMSILQSRSREISSTSSIP